MSGQVGLGRTVRTPEEAARYPVLHEARQPRRPRQTGDGTRVRTRYGAAGQGGAILRNANLSPLPGTYLVNGSAVRAARQRRGWRQDDFAAVFGTSQATVWCLEASRRFANEAAARQVATVLTGNANNWRQFVYDPDATQERASA